MPLFSLGSKNIPQGIIFLLQRASSATHLHQIHGFIIKNCQLQNIFITAKFLRQCLCISLHEILPYTRSVFERIASPDAFIWNTMIRAYLHADHPQESIALYNRMLLEADVVVDSFSLSLAVQACGKNKDENNGRKIHTHVVKLGYPSDMYVQTALVEMYAKFGSWGCSRQVLNEMLNPDVVTYNVLLAEYVTCGDIKAARVLFDEMPEKDKVSWNTLIHGYAANGDVTAARLLFDSSSSKDLVSWSSIIAAYCRSDQPQEALKLFCEMQLANVVPDEVVLVSVLSACGDVGALGMGRMVHWLIQSKRLEVDVELGTSLVEMYAKCGDINSAFQVFNGMDRKDVLTWNSVISGLANHGYGKAALDLFSQMVSIGVRPNDVIFVSVLTACNHVGFVSKGWELFTSMSDKYGISPKIEHYGCMVDILGRAGHLQQARELIDSMPFAPDAIVWRALLGACRIHRNVELAEAALRNLVALEPNVEGHYILLSNIYAQAKEWDGVAKVRRMMRNMNVLKNPGSSSIEVDNAVREFVVDDQSHPKSKEIYQMLAEMSPLLEFAGYSSTTFLDLWDMAEHGIEGRAG